MNPASMKKLRELRRKVGLIACTHFESQCLRGAMIEFIEELLLDAGDNQFQEESASFFAPEVQSAQPMAQNVQMLPSAPLMRVGDKPQVQIIEAQPVHEPAALIVDMQKDVPLIGEVLGSDEATPTETPKGKKRR